MIYHGDCLDVMPTLPADSVDSIVCDPPYGLGFMGKDWDHGVPGAHFWAEALRVAKPGAHLLAFGGTRTYHRLTCAIEDAGWEIRDCLMWVYGSGFPKSKNIEGGRGTALKPAWEPIILARKPLEGTVGQNAEKWGVGALNIDDCRVSWTDGAVPKIGTPSWGGPSKKLTVVPGQDGDTVERSKPSQLGRWPANLIHDGSDEVLAAFPQAPGQMATVGPEHGDRPSVNAYGDYGPRPHTEPRIEADKSAARFFYCAKASKKDRDEGCESLDDKVLAMSNQAKAEQARGNLHSGDSGMNTGKKRKNNHPTVKPTALMRYLCRLVTPPGGLILDPFMGSGSTGKAALLEGFRFTGIELNPEYIEIARARMDFADSTADAEKQDDCSPEQFRMVLA